MLNYASKWGKGEWLFLFRCGVKNTSYRKRQFPSERGAIRANAKIEKAFAACGQNGTVSDK
jgi:hypothetical protein